MWNNLRLVSTSSAPVLSVEDAKLHLRITGSDDDAYIANLIEVATAYIDGPYGIGIALREQTWRASLTARYTDLPLRPVRSIISVSRGATDLSFIYRDGILDCADYRDAEVLFSVGFDAVPADILHAMRMVVAHLHANREAVSATALTHVPMAVDTILNRYRPHFTGVIS